MINFKITNAEVTDQLKAVAESKLATLDKFIGEAPAICDMEFEKITHHQQGDVHRVEVNLELNGKLFRVEASEETFEKAIDEVKAELEEGLRRARGKEDTLLRKGGRRLKQILRWGR